MAETDSATTIVLLIPQRLITNPRQGTPFARIQLTPRLFVAVMQSPEGTAPQLRASVCYCLLHHALPNLERKEISRAQIIRLCECLKVKSYAGNRHETIMHPLDEPRCWSLIASGSVRCARFWDDCLHEARAFSDKLKALAPNKKVSPGIASTWTMIPCSITRRVQRVNISGHGA